MVVTCNGKILVKTTNLKSNYGPTKEVIIILELRMLLI